MSILSKLKASKKAADEHKAKMTVEESPEKKPTVAYKHVPTHAATDALTSAPGNWKADEIKYQNQARLSRIGSDYSTRPATSHVTTSSPSRPTRPGFNRAHSDSSLDFTPPPSQPFMPLPKSTGSSLKTTSRNTSYQGLEKVVEDSHTDAEPVFAAALLATRSKASRSPRGSARLSTGKSPLSSVECSADNSPVESEASSEASGSASDHIELSSRPVKHTPVHDIHPGSKVNDMFPEQSERKYFTHKYPTVESKEMPVLEPVRKERFSFMKRSGGAVAAH